MICFDSFLDLFEWLVLNTSSDLSLPPLVTLEWFMSCLCRPYYLFCTQTLYVIRPHLTSHLSRPPLKTYLSDFSCSWRPDILFCIQSLHVIRSFIITWNGSSKVICKTEYISYDPFTSVKFFSILWWGHLYNEVYQDPVYIFLSEAQNHFSNSVTAYAAVKLVQSMATISHQNTSRMKSLSIPFQLF